MIFGDFYIYGSINHHREVFCRLPVPCVDGQEPQRIQDGWPARLQMTEPRIHDIAERQIHDHGYHHLVVKVVNMMGPATPGWRCASLCAGKVSNGQNICQSNMYHRI